MLFAVFLGTLCLFVPLPKLGWHFPFQPLKRTKHNPKRNCCSPLRLNHPPRQKTTTKNIHRKLHFLFNLPPPQETELFKQTILQSPPQTKSTNQSSVNQKTNDCSSLSIPQKHCPLAPGDLRRCRRRRCRRHRRQRRGHRPCGGVPRRLADCNSEETKQNGLRKGSALKTGVWVCENA